MYYLIDVKKTGQNLKRLFQINGFTVSQIQKELHIGSPQAIYRMALHGLKILKDHQFRLQEVFQNMSASALLASAQAFHSLRKRFQIVETF